MYWPEHGTVTVECSIKFKDGYCKSNEGGKIEVETVQIEGGDTPEVATLNKPQTIDEEMQLPTYDALGPNFE